MLRLTILPSLKLRENKVQNEQIEKIVTLTICPERKLIGAQKM